MGFNKEGAKRRCRLKICGLTRFRDVLSVNEVLPDYAGFVFAESRRGVSHDRARQLRERMDRRIQAVGVFVNAPVEEVLRLTGEDGGFAPAIDWIQLHGEEDEAYMKRLRYYSSRPVIRAVRMEGRESAVRAAELPCDFLLLDAAAGGKRGGTGTGFDWNMIPELKKPFFLAGGIRAENIRQAAALGPYGIDVSSGAEKEGKKDRGMMEELDRLLRM